MYNDSSVSLAQIHVLLISFSICIPFYHSLKADIGLVFEFI
jgi:hypothetical protein